MTSDYKPIACGTYDELELMAMHRAEVVLIYRDESGAEQQLSGRVVDTAIHDHAEFLVLESGVERQEFRLDRILDIEDQMTGAHWRQKIDE